MSPPTKSNPKPNDANALTAVLATLVYFYFFGIFLLWFAWMVPNDHLPGNLAEYVPYNMDTAKTTSSPTKDAFFDLFLLVSFAIPHSIFARRKVKDAMKIPNSLERTFFVLQSAGFMHIFMRFWRNFDPDYTLWSVPVDSAGSYVLLAGFALGALFLLSASFALDHFHLFGLSQGFGIDFNQKLGLAPKDQEEGQLVVRWHYSLVAHPIMTGVFVCAWSHPVMSASRLLNAIVLSLYILVAVTRFEEPSLAAVIGPSYQEYLATVPRFIPGMPVLCRRHRDSSSDDDQQKESSVSQEQALATPNVGPVNDDTELGDYGSC